MSFIHRATVVCILLQTLSMGAIAQPGSMFSFRGSLGLHYDAYRYSETNYENFRPRHPSYLGRFNANATLSAGRHFVMPFSMNITTGQNSYHVPSKPDERLIDYIQNPRNNISFNPQYRWVKGYFGTQTPAYSPLTTGDIAMFGIGVELDPGNFLFTLNYGKSQIGVEFDPVNNVAGAYEQHIIAARVGYGKQEGTHMVFNIVKASDDEASIQAMSPGVRPGEGVTFSPIVQVRLTESLLFKTELAASAFTHNLLGPELPYDNQLIDILDGFMHVNASTNADWSNQTSLEWRSERFSIGGEFQYIGPGFQAAGFRLIERDLIDYKLNSRVSLLANRLIVSGSVGLRTNNLKNTTRDKTHRTIINANVFTQVTERFSLNTNYANFGFRNNVSLDTLRVEMINHTVSVSPNWQIRSDNKTHVVSGTISYSHFDDYNMFVGQFQQTTSFSMSGNYQVLFDSMPLSFGGMGMYLANSTPAVDMQIINAGLNARYRLLDKRLVPSLLFMYTHIARDFFSADHRLRTNIKLDFKLTDFADLKTSWNISTYRYGSSRPDARTIENRFQISLVSRF